MLVDDGLATGATMRAAVTALKQQQPKKIIVAVPVAARQTCDEFRREVDAMCVCAIKPEPFDGVGRWHRNFSQTTDEEARDLLTQSADEWESRHAASAGIGVATLRQKP